jgi:CubicO group peptidase (beta-lactamase class C family)
MTSIDAALARIDTLMGDFIGTSTAPGIAYGVVRDGELAHSGGAGVTHLEGGWTPDADTVFRIASMTKSFTAAAILMIRDQGLLALDAPVSTYIPELAAVALPSSDSRPPTVRDMLTMSAGWATDDPWADRQESLDPAGFTAMIEAGLTFDETPGVVFDYSNLGYSLLGRIITNVSGEQFQDFITAKILRPVGMASSGFRREDIPVERVADGHFRRDDTWNVEPWAATGEFAALGGIASSVRDLSRWVATMTGAFPARDDVDTAVPLRRSSLREMQQGTRFFTAQRGVETGTDYVRGESMSYGFGLVNSVDERFGDIVSHSGGYPGYGSHMCWHPATGLGFIGLANGRYASPGRTAARQALNALLEAVDAPARRIRLTGATRTAQAQVDALLDTWDDAAADRLFSPNVDLDLPREYRRREIQEAIEKVGGLVGPAQKLTATTPSAIEWVRPGVAGRLKIDIQLMPRLEQRVQTLGVQVVPAPSEKLRSIASTVIDALLVDDAQWPDGVVTDTSVDHAAVLQGAAAARSIGAAAALPEHPSSARDQFDASFALKGRGATTTLKIAIDAVSEVVTHCSFTTAADAWAARTEIIG